MPIVASSESFQPIEKTLTGFLANGESDPSETAAHLVVASQETYKDPSSSSKAYVSTFPTPRYPALGLLEDMLESPRQASILTGVIAQAYVDSPTHDAGGDRFDIFPSESNEHSAYSAISQQANPLPQNEHGVEHRNPADIDTVEISIPKSQNIVSAIAHLDRSLIALPTVEVASASADDYGKSVLQAPFQLSGQQQSSQALANVTQCSLSASPVAMSDAGSEHISQLKVNANDVPTVSQVTIDGSTVAEFTEQDKALYFAEAVKAFIRSDYFLPHELEIRWNGESYMIATQDSVVIQMSPEIMPVGYDHALVAIAWTNNLRTTLGAEPLSMGEAQAQIQSLTANGQQVAGVASWYGPYFHGRLTASGEYFDQNELTAAHPTLPFDTYLNVTNLKNGRTVVVRINDRGPYIGRRSLDLSRRAAQCLGSEETGVVPYAATLLEASQSEATQSAEVSWAEPSLN
ncbi:MAG: septal ring lytic transglycosylase RlpA family protein [Leptolyngbyaceae bacterium]|nr:septal ring lytic transglycosylase RlpA family protein [Leptolyngbyaceae bacterium]